MEIDLNVKHVNVHIVMVIINSCHGNYFTTLTLSQSSL